MDRRTLLVRTAQVGMSFGMLRYLGACRRPQASATGTDATFLSLRDEYFLRTLELNPVTSTYLGGDGYDPSLRDINGQLRDFSEQGLAAEARLYRSYRTRLDAFDLTRLDQTNRIDHAVMTAQLDFLLHQFARGQHERAVDTYVAEPFRGVDWQIQQMRAFEGKDLGTLDEWNLVIARLEAVAAYLANARANLLAGKANDNLPDHRMVQRDGIAGSQANADYFRNTLPATAKTYLGSRPFAAKTLARLAEAGAAAADAFQGFAGFLQQAYNVDETVDRYAIGEEEYAWRVLNCLQVDRTPQQLWDYGAEQVALYESRLFDVAQEVARAAQLGLKFDSDADRRTSTRAVMDFLAKDSPRNDAELFRWYREVADRAVAYGREQAMFDIPADYRLEIVPTPPVLRSTIDAAYYPAPPFKHAGVGRFYLTPTGNDPAALKLNNHASVADTAVHEGFPGHDWHYKYMTQHAAEISNIRWLTPGSVEDSSSMWEDSMAAEGWALYAEELMAEPAAGRPHGFYTPAEHLYELQGQLLRAVRVRVDVGLHTGRMSYDQALDYFTERVSFYPQACEAAPDDDTARAICDGAQRAIYRYSKWPTQAITYNLGKSEIMNLRSAYKEEHTPTPGGTPTKDWLKHFHEAFMGMGTIPPGYFEEALLRS